MCTSNRSASLFGFVTSGALLGLALASAAAEIRVGCATRDITPPLGMPMAGYYHERGADGVLDPLFSKAIVIESGGEKTALVTLDIISITREITEAARETIQAKSGIKGEYVMVSATHAHTGPELAGRGLRAAGVNGSSSLAADYTRKLPALIAETVELASRNLKPARLSVARGKCENLAYNRRYFMRDGSVGWNPGKLNPDIVMPAGPSDPELGVLYAELPDANAPANSLCTYVNFAMHPDTTGGSKFSADWPGALGRLLAGYHGSNHVTLVGNGACGNINHLDFSWKWINSGPFEQTRIATILGASVFLAYKDLRPLSPGALRARTERVELPLPDITTTQIEEARAATAATKDDRGGNFMKLVRAYRVLDVAERKGEPYKVEVQGIAFGREVAFVSLPGEVFVELGLAIKKRSPFAHTFVVELANESIGYIPDRRSFAEGNYEPESARCAPGSGEKLVEAASALLARLHAEAGANPATPQ